MEKRVYNFSAGPSMLPLEVLEQAQRELVCYPSAGMSVMEMSHRSKTFENILEKAKADLKELMHIPDNYKILFLQGGGSTQFAMIPMNLMNKNNKADYVITGQWQSGGVLPHLHERGDTPHHPRKSRPQPHLLRRDRGRRAALLPEHRDEDRPLRGQAPPPALHRTDGA